MFVNANFVCFKNRYWLLLASHSIAASLSETQNNKLESSEGQTSPFVEISQQTPIKHKHLFCRTIYSMKLCRLARVSTLPKVAHVTVWTSVIVVSEMAQLLMPLLCIEQQHAKADAENDEFPWYLPFKEGTLLCIT